MKKVKGDALVSVVMGSDSDLPTMKESLILLKQFEIPYEVVLTSAHRTPERTSEFAKGAAGRGVRVIIVGAGAAAHLAGVIASQTPLPVIGVPIDSTSLGGLDALLSTVQMPGGIPVATMPVGKAGARNAALMAARVLALGDRGIAGKLKGYAEKMAAEVKEKQKKLDCL
ncbi:MAG TPA: 5-(carboxyamino)imidazole ribonucleotide mutase [Syntrophales bacterium]|mgnify:CR=1 FL=1|jgi:phosphoribosylaminoimidazole carboxylase PurE protein|nr:5-(carboxyamino)imidazole ribonucleotide mutase [Syntrophales bacterium]HOX94919.1 5-(carboxyamino)imidazole ribonucleotide mutase [Syntrophales bacterium]HPI58255.1 5-(carboxyamino)imidazole ribonucleotide mutase [Syntrophales bacterium]HPN25308.1 5-(carboxyamino)imidazole ribonucleotide mutase [Syntrophales bacterium]HQM29600.1 5-(carboxyamino)imidazole ribonucleotide mutase [Syntrophales bacterium]